MVKSFELFCFRSVMARVQFSDVSCDKLAVAERMFPTQIASHLCFFFFFLFFNAIEKYVRTYYKKTTRVNNLFSGSLFSLQVVKVGAVRRGTGAEWSHRRTISLEQHLFSIYINSGPGWFIWSCCSHLYGRGRISGDMTNGCLPNRISYDNAKWWLYFAVYALSDGLAESFFDSRVNISPCCRRDSWNRDTGAIWWRYIFSHPSIITLLAMTNVYGLLLWEAV